MNKRACTVKRKPVKKVAKKKWVPAPRLPGGDEQLRRVRRLCESLPRTTEKVSHGSPTFFVDQRVYVMFVNNHHDDGHLAVWLPVLPGSQASLIRAEPRKFFMPPYVGVKGWIGIELDAIGEDELAFYVCEAWRMIARNKQPS
jgi:hypothetical protein